MYQQNESLEKDNELADFADRIMSGSANDSASTSDEDLLSLEKTLLRLNSAIPPKKLEDAQVKQMLVRLKTRTRREEDAAVSKPSFWKRLFDFQANPQVGLLFAVAAMVIIAVIALPALQVPGSSVSGTATSSGRSLFPILGGLGVLFVMYWLSRRK